MYKWLLIYLFLLLQGCDQISQKAKSTNSRLSSNKNCQNILLPANRLSSQFVIDFVNCLSFGRSNSHSSLPATQILIENISSQGIDASLNILSDKNTDNTYPYLSSLMTFATLGQLAHPSDNYVISYEEAKLVIDLLSHLNVDKLLAILKDLQTANKLPWLMEKIATLTRTLEPGTASSLLKLTVQDDDFRQLLFELLQTLLTNKDIIAPINNIMNLSKSQYIGQPVVDNCIQKWQEIMPWQSYNSKCNVQSESNENEPILSGEERFLQTWNKLQLYHKPILKALSELGSYLASLEPNKRQHLFEHLHFASTYFLHHKQLPLHQLVHILDQTIHLKVQTLSPIIESINSIFASGNKNILTRLQEKSAIIKLEEKLTDYLINGGKIPGCDGYIFSGISHMPYKKAFEELLTPNGSCQIKIKVESQQFCQVNLEGTPIDEEECAIHVAPLVSAIISETTSTPLTAARLKWLTANAYSNPSSADTNQLYEYLVFVLDNVKSQLASNPYYLFNLNLANQSINLEIWDKVTEKIALDNNLSVSKLVDIDEQIANDSYLNKFFYPNLLEKLIKLNSNELSTIATLFSSFEEENRDEDVFRVFSGAYRNGPLESVLKNSLSYTYLQGSNTKLAETDYLLASIWQRLTDIYTITKHPIWSKGSGQSFQWETFGQDEKHSMQIIQNKKITYNLNSPISHNLLLADGNIGESAEKWALFSDILDKGPLNLVSTPHGLEALYKSHLTNNVLAEISSASMFTNLGDVPQNRDELKSFWQRSLSFYDITPYTPSKLRAISLFYLMNAHYSPNFNHSSFTLQPREIKRRLEKNFLIGSSFLASFGNSFSTFKRFLPKCLQTNDSNLCQSITSSLPDSYSSLQNIYDRFKDDQPNFETFIDALNQHEMVKLLTTFNLMEGLRTRRGNQDLTIHPALGAGQSLCPSRIDDSSACLIESKECQGDSCLSAFGESVCQIAASYFCQLIDSKRNIDNQHFSHLMANQLNLNDTSLCQGQLLENAYDSLSIEEGKLPRWWIEWSLQNIIEIGEKPEVKKWLFWLPFDIKLEKLQRKYNMTSPSKELLVEIIQSAPAINSNMNAFVKFRSSEYHLMWQDFPSFLNQLIHFTFYSIDQISLTEELITHSPSDRTFDTVNKWLNFLMKTENQDKSLLEVGLEILTDCSPEELDLISSFLANPYGLETGSLLGEELAIFLGYVFESITDNQADPLFWQKEEIVLLKTLLNKPFLSAIMHFVNQFDTTAWFKALREIKNFIDNMNGSKNTSEFFTALNDSFKKWAFAIPINQNASTTNLTNLESSLKQLFSAHLPTKISYNSNILISKLSQNLLDYQNNQVRALPDQLYPLLNLATTEIWDILKTYQSLPVYLYQSNPIFIAETTKDLIKPLSLPAGHFHTLDRFLSMPRIGLHDNRWPNFLLSDNLQKESAILLGHALLLKNNEILAALQEATQLAKGSYYLLNLLDKKLLWKKDTSQDLKYFLDSIHFMSKDESTFALWMSLIKSWQ